MLNVTRCSNTHVKRYFTNRTSARGRHVAVHLIRETAWQYFYKFLSQLRNFFYENLLLMQYLEFYENFMLRKFGAIR